ncbi:MAG: FIST signal transduction protein [bacterium]
MELNVGFSKEEDFEKAISIALSKSVNDLSEEVFLFVFLTEDYVSQDNYRIIKEMLKDRRFIGSTTAGIIYDGDVYLKGVGVVAFGRGFQLLHSEVKEGLSENGRIVGERFASECIDKIQSNRSAGRTENRLCFIFPDGVSSNIEAMIKGLSFNLPVMNYIGGGSGDNLRFLKTMQFSNDSFTNNAVACAVFNCSGEVGVGVAHGFHPLSNLLIATSVEGNKLKQINWQDALKFYCSFLKVAPDNVKGEIAKIALSNPIGVVQWSHSGESFIIRDIISCDDEGWIYTVGEIPLNSTICIMEGDRDSLREAALVASRNAKIGVKGEVSGYIIFSCVSRYVFLGENYYRKK